MTSTSTRSPQATDGWPVAGSRPTAQAVPAGLADPRLAAWRTLLAAACVEVLRRYEGAWAQAPDAAARAAAAVGVVDHRPVLDLLPFPSEGELARLVAVAGLTRADEAVLAATWWSAVDPQVAVLLGCVHDDSTRRHATLGVLAQVLAPVGVGVPLVIGEHHPLVRSGLLDPVPDAATPLRLPAATVAVLAGDRAPAPATGPVAPRLAGVAARVRRLLDADARVLVRCAVPDDRAPVRDAVASLLGIAVAPVPRPAPAAALLRALGHELPAVLLEDDTPPPEGTVLALGGPTCASPAGWHAVEVPPPSLDAAVQVWRAALRRAGLRASGPVLADLAGRLPLAERTIGEVVADAATAAGALDRPLRPDDVTAALRAHPRQDPGGLARRSAASVGLEDLVLPRTTQDALADFLAHARWSPAAHAALGLHGARGRAVIALFHGPSGTGKTAAVEAAAAALDRDLWTVDLAKVVSKWLGETQRHLDTVLSQAATAGALLLFDEADGLFGKRGEVTDARDRYANLEIDHLLQRIELHEGVVVLTSNRPGALDDAFARRIRLAVRFELPDHAQREEIWARYLPDAMLEDGASRATVAREELSGAAIRSAALAAEVSAIAAGTRVRDEHLAAAVGRELEKNRRPPTARSAATGVRR